ncbi:flagellin [Patulibacter brassicae]|jgi:flagellin|uniref:Flagellin n=1 Tax=Patulibacter brassicae TaxID=1705717 RepID=A0ABU4VP58_9ACTN|nr:flagellin [Patulibacter brassicae]MDX8152824.1 flagellin [Patulibacter brassicae]MDX8152828.1 flagellin [Patulibacter brassicae]
MSLRINTNVEAFNAHRNLGNTSGATAKSMERLSSGLRINRAADDAAGLAISEKLRGQVGGLDQARRNAQDGISLVQTAEGSLTEVHSILQRVRTLAVQYQNGTLNATNRSAIDSEVTQLTTELGAIGSRAEFNGQKLLNAAGSVTFQVGANDSETTSVALISLGSSLGSIAGATTLSGVTVATIDTAINNISQARANFGAVQNRLEHTLNHLSVYQENLSASESRIRDVDMAQEMVSFTKNQVLQQAGTAILAQANQASQGVLSLLR